MTCRTAGYGPVCPVVWEGKRGTTPRSPILIQAGSSSVNVAEPVNDFETLAS
jgi:hypothetical protein